MGVADVVICAAPTLAPLPLPVHASVALSRVALVHVSGSEVDVSCIPRTITPIPPELTVSAGPLNGSNPVPLVGVGVDVGVAELRPVKSPDHAQAALNPADDVAVKEAVEPLIVPPVLSK